MAPLDRADILYYTTNYGPGPTLADIAASSWLGNRLPTDRHGGRIAVAFTDGHAEIVSKTDYSRIRVSPW